MDPRCFDNNSPVCGSRDVKHDPIFRVDPKIALLVRYAEGFGRSDSDIRNMSHERFEAVQEADRLRSENKDLKRMHDYYRDLYNQYADLLTEANKKIEKLTKKTTKKVIKKGKK